MMVYPTEESLSLSAEMEAQRLFEMGYRAMSVMIEVDDGVERRYTVFHAASVCVLIVTQRFDNTLDVQPELGVPVSPEILEVFDWVLYLLDALTYYYYTGLAAYTAA